jgi:hypothetical protein
MSRAGEFAPGERFEVRAELGAGGMGVVYEAYDRQRRSRVALKTLRRVDPESVYRLKREFRALQDLEHPNLVGFGELFCEQGQWFFSMELVEGADFVSYVRGARAVTAAGERVAAAPTAVDDFAGGPTAPGFGATRGEQLDEHRLRGALRQLVLGVSALHAGERVHRDIKPSNIRVRADGRLQLLDFGLVIQSAPRGDRSETRVVGTAAYMAPEQAAALRPGPAADWYSVGAVLYEALTGVAPFCGAPLQILLDKQRFEPPPPGAIAGGLPRDLEALAAALLRRDPDQRPIGREIMARLGTSCADPLGAVGSVSRSTGAGLGVAFVGRAGELAALDGAFEAAREGTVLALVVGESGVGKSALVREFVHRLELRESGALVLEGRGAEAAEAFVAAAVGAEAATQLEQRRRAAEQLLMAGRVEPGLATLRDVLRATGVELPVTPRRALMSIAWHKLVLGLRGSRWRSRDESEIAAAELRRTDIYRSASLSLAMIDTVRAYEFQLRCVLASLRAGEPRRIARARDRGDLPRDHRRAGRGAGAQARQPGRSHRRADGRPGDGRVGSRDPRTGRVFLRLDAGPCLALNYVHVHVHVRGRGRGRYEHEHEHAHAHEPRDQ